tara:strand:- start:1829 stop:2023 length:195 start_codon:yes stop_codon:yes gene_type:complete
MLSRLHQLNQKRIIINKYKYNRFTKTESSKYIDTELNDIRENILALKEELRLFQNCPENMLIGL